MRGLAFSLRRGVSPIPPAALWPQRPAQAFHGLSGQRAGLLGIGRWSAGGPGLVLRVLVGVMGCGHGCPEDSSHSGVRGPRGAAVSQARPAPRTHQHAVQREEAPDPEVAAPPGVSARVQQHV